MQCEAQKNSNQKTNNRQKLRKIQEIEKLMAGV
jgi:hypothetical protein